MKHRLVFNALLIVGGVALGWFGHEMLDSTRPSTIDSVAANWATLATALVGEDGPKSADDVKDSTAASLIALTGALGANYSQLENAQLQANVMSLARNLQANPEIFDSVKLPAHGESAKLIALCISIYGGSLDPGKVEECSTKALTLKVGKPG